MSLVAPIESPASAWAELIPDLDGASLIWVNRLKGGRNSQVFAVRSDDGRRYVVKRYFRSRDDERDRLGSEYYGLRFLWRNGVRAIPQPLAVDWTNRQAVYSFVEGRPIEPGRATAGAVDQAVDFLASLQEIRFRPGHEALPLASEACLSGRAIIDNLRLRRTRLDGLDGAEPEYEELARLLAEEYQPLLAELTGWLEPQMAELDFESEIPKEERVLSPSDFGFHNALQLDDGRIVFLDFEYFGWDDPAKMAADFLLHPAMELSRDLKRRFTGRLLERIDPAGSIARRLAAYYPLFGLKWCLILLNEFIPADYERRRFAAGGNDDRRKTLAGQLDKARRMLTRIRREYERFPYLG